MFDVLKDIISQKKLIKSDEIYNDILNVQTYISCKE